MRHTPHLIDGPATIDSGGEIYAVSDSGKPRRLQPADYWGQSYGSYQKPELEL